LSAVCEEKIEPNAEDDRLSSQENERRTSEIRIPVGFTDVDTKSVHEDLANRTTFRVSMWITQLHVSYKGAWVPRLEQTVTNV